MADNVESFRVAVVGGGIAGLTCAVYLQRAGVEIDVYEAAAKFGEIGAGVDFGNNALRALKDLGILNVLLQTVGQPSPHTFAFTSGEDTSQTTYNYPASESEVGLSLYRPVYLDALIAAFDHSRAHFHKHCVGVNQDDEKSPCILKFADGSSAEADVVLGCDGIRSAVRGAIDPPSESEKGEQRGEHTKEVSAEDKHLIFTKTIAYRGLVETSKFQSEGIKLETKKRSIIYGNGRHIVLFPIEGGRVMNIVAFVQEKGQKGKLESGPSDKWVATADQKDMSRDFESFDENVRKMLSLIDQPSRWSIHAIDPLRTYVKGRVALLGDAAHAMLPHLGAGAGQAIEDARLISKLLVHPSCTRDTIPAILSAYSELRQPRANEVILASAAAGDKYDGFGPSGPSGEGRKKDLEGQWSFVWHHDHAMEEQAAISHFQEKLEIEP